MTNLEGRTFSDLVLDMDRVDLYGGGATRLSRRAHPDKVRANSKTWYADHQDQIRAIHRRSKYGLTPEKHQQMYDSQGGLCAICRVGWATHVDHDHSTGKVRGLLCRQCNAGLGQFSDQPSLLASAMEYLAHV